jgi:signal transduction histidine kinase
VPFFAVEEQVIARAGIRKKFPASAEVLTLLLAFLSVALIGILSYNEWAAYRRLSDQIKITQAIATSTAALRSALTDAETGQRGFLLTGQDDYTASYRKAVSEVPTAVTALAAAVAPRPRQHTREQLLAPLVQQKLNDLERTIEVRRAQGADPALAIVRRGQGKETMDQILRICAEMETAAYSRLSTQTAEANAAVNQARLITVTGSALLLGLIIIASITIERGIRRRDQLYEESQAARLAAEHSELALTRTNEELQQFAYAASHDLQEPLRTIRIYTEVLMDGRTRLDDQRAREAMNFVTTGTDRMGQLVTALLEYSRAGAASNNPLAEIQIEEILAKTLASMQGVIEKNGAAITHDPLPAVKADETQFAQLLQNLVDNAIKYRGSELPRIHVSASEGSGQWIFSVADNGEGIDGAYASQVFQVFKRLHGPEKPGSGIGLATCKKIVERHGGRIWLESQVGRGSTFFFTVPKMD